MHGLSGLSRRRRRARTISGSGIGSLALRLASCARRLSIDRLASSPSSAMASAKRCSAYDGPSRRADCVALAAVVGVNQSARRRSNRAAGWSSSASMARHGFGGMR
jgi:hypothetical protein